MRRSRNSVVLLAACVQVCAFVLPLFTLKANRVESGHALYSWDLFPLVFCIAVPVGIFFLLVYSVYSTRHSIVSGDVSGSSAMGGSANSMRTGSYARTQNYGTEHTLTQQHIRRMFFLQIVVVCFYVAYGCITIVMSAKFAQALGQSSRLGLNVGFWSALLSAFIITHSLVCTTAASLRVRTVLLVGIPTIYAVCTASGLFAHIGIYKEFVNNQSRFVEELLNHLFLTFSSVGIATIIGVPLGICAWRNKRMGQAIFSLVNGMQTIPSLALFGLIIAPLSIITRVFPVLRSIGIKGIGNTPAIIALSLYALLPIVQNTYSGLANIPHAVIDAGVGMGMNRRQLWNNIEFPLAFAIMFSGFRIAAVQTVGNATIAALIGASGLGNFIFRGLGAAAVDLIVLGVIPVVLISMLLDSGLTHINKIYHACVLHQELA